MRLLCGVDWQSLKNDCTCLTCAHPVGGTVGAKISTWAAHSEWKTLESLVFAVKFQLVFRYETVVFRRYVLSLLLVVPMQKFEAYLVYVSLIWGKIPRRFLCFQKVCHFSYIFHDFPARISDACAIVFRLWRSGLQYRSQFLRSLLTNGWKTRDSRRNHFRHAHRCRLQNLVISFVILKWLLPGSLAFWPLVKGIEDPGNEIV